MHAQSTASANWPVGLILKVAVLNALLVTVVSALAITLWSGAGVPSKPLELGKTVILLCPITAVSCGSFGLLAGLAGATLIYLRRRRLRSTKRFLVEAAVIGFVLAFFFPEFDVLMSRVQGFLYYSGPAVVALTPAFGIPCGLICALIFRNGFMAAK